MDHQRPNPATDALSVDGPQERLDRLNAEVDALREQLRRAQRLASVGTMTAMVAHEFNNILTPIINYAQLAQDQPDLADKAIDKAAKGGQRAQTICQALLGLCRGPKQRVTVDMADVINEAVSAMVRHPSRDGIELDLHVTPGKITTRAVELQQVLLNLLLNARRAVLAGRGRRWIELTAEQTDGQWVVRVADGGVGIPSGDVERVFEPFYSTADPDAGDGGFGLGLTICREIVQSLGGTIVADGTVSRGACFEIHLPAA